MTGVSVTIQKSAQAFARAVAVACIALALCASPALSQSNDSWLEPVYVTPENIGTYNVRNDVTWFKEVQNDIHVGYQTIEYKVSDSNIIITNRAKEDIPYIHYRGDFESVVYAEPFTLRPVRQTLSSVMRDSSGKLTLYKDIYFDWKFGKITIVPGKEKGLPVRTVKIPKDAVPADAVYLFLTEKKNLIVGAEYRFFVFDPMDEKFIQSSAKILGKTKDGVFDVLIGLPTAYGDVGDKHIFISPKSDKYPNGVTFRQIYLLYHGKMVMKVSLIRTSMEKATKIEKK